MEYHNNINFIYVEDEIDKDFEDFEYEDEDED